MICITVFSPRRPIYRSLAKTMNVCYPLQNRADYDSLEGLNASLFKTAVHRTPKHAYLEHLDPNRVPISSPAFRIGTLAHLRLLEPHVWDAVQVCEHGTRTKAYQAARAEAESAGAPFAAKDEYELADALGESVLRHPVLGSVFRRLSAPDPRNELSLGWVLNGTKIKSRIDAIRFNPSETVIYDLKTAIDGSPEAVGKAAYDRLWFVQAATYYDGVKACLRSMEAQFDLPEESLTKKPLVFEFVVVEKTGDHQVARYRVTSEQLETGRALYRLGMQKIVKAQSVDYYSGYPVAARPLELPYWADRNLAALLTDDDA